MNKLETKTVIISQSSKANTEMVVIQTPIEGVKNRKGEQAYTSVTKHRQSPIKTEKKIGSNNLVIIKKGDAVKVLKYRNAQEYLNQGWTITD